MQWNFWPGCETQPPLWRAVTQSESTAWEQRSHRVDWQRNARNVLGWRAQGLAPLHALGTLGTLHQALLGWRSHGGAKRGEARGDPDLPMDQLMIYRHNSACEQGIWSHANPPHSYAGLALGCISTYISCSALIIILLSYFLFACWSSGTFLKELCKKSVTKHIFLVLTSNWTSIVLQKLPFPLFCCTLPSPSPGFLVVPRESSHMQTQEAGIRYLMDI